MAVPQNQNQAPDLLPAQCLNPACGYSFYAPNMIFVGGNSRNITVSNTRTQCVRCGGEALIQDWKIDDKGKFQLGYFLGELKGFSDTSALKSLLEEMKGLESANDDRLTAENLADSISSLDRRFSKFHSMLASIPDRKLPEFITLLVAFLTLLVTTAQYFESKEFNEKSYETQKEQVEISRQAHELEKEKFEYQKKNDEAQIRKLEQQVESLRQSFEDSPIEQKQVEPPIRGLLKAGTKLKGCYRNKPCLCGSGLKAKKCHPYGVS